MAARKSPYVSPRVAELLAKLKKITMEARSPHAVGGALAMATHGYRRHTDDIDVFVRPEDLRKWKAAARKHGLILFDPSGNDAQIVAYMPKHIDAENPRAIPDEHIDFLPATDDAEREALEHAAPGDVGGKKFNVVTADFLAMIKVLSDRDWKDHPDFFAMLDKDIVFVETIRFMVSKFGAAELRRFDKIVTSYRASKSKQGLAYGVSSRRSRATRRV